MVEQNPLVLAHRWHVSLIIQAQLSVVLSYLLEFLNWNSGTGNFVWNFSRIYAVIWSLHTNFRRFCWFLLSYRVPSTCASIWMFFIIDREPAIFVYRRFLRFMFFHYFPCKLTIFGMTLGRLASETLRFMLFLVFVFQISLAAYIEGTIGVRFSESFFSR